MYRLELVIEGLPKTTNSNVGHWTKRMKHADLWKRKVIQAVVFSKNLPEKPLSKARLTLTRSSCIACDFDGLVSSFKHLVDGLKLAGVILDDHMGIIGQPEYRHEKGKRNKGFVRIVVEQLA